MLASDEVEGKLDALSAFSSTVKGAMEEATERRADAQRTLEALAIEQRTAAEAMRVSVGDALKRMEKMQREWDAAVDANAVELRSLKSETAEVLGRQDETFDGLNQLKKELGEQTVAMSSAVSRRRALADEEAAMRKRFNDLRRQRLAKLGINDDDDDGSGSGGDAAAPIDLGNIFGGFFGSQKE